MYGPLVDGSTSSSSPVPPSSTTPATIALEPDSTKIFTDDAGIRALGATRRRIDTMLRWMSSTSVTAGPPLITLPIHFSSSNSTTRRNSSELPSKYFLSPGFDSARPSRSLLSILVPKKRAQPLSSFMSGSAGSFGDKDSNLDEQLQRLLSYH